MVIRVLRHVATLFGSALILMFFSEYFFLNEGPVQTIITQIETDPAQVVFGLLEFSLYYALFTYTLLLAIQYFDVRRLSDLFLAGALFGWATEAVIVPIAYEAVPFSFIFPSVSWHALVDVMLGWYLVRRVTRMNRLWLSLGLFVILGVLWGSWATWLWGTAESSAPLTTDEFTDYVFVTGVLWIIGMILVDGFGTTHFRASRWESIIVMGITLFLFGAMAVPFLPFSLGLVVLIGITLLALRRRPDDGQDWLYPLRETRPAWWNYPLALLTPFTAMLVYSLYVEAERGIPTEDLTFILLLVGTVLLLASLIRPFLNRTASPRN